MFTLTVFKILLFEGSWVLWPAQRVLVIERVKWKTQHNNGCSLLWTIHMTVLSTLKKGADNLAYFDKKNCSSQYKNKNTCSGLFKVNNRNTKRSFGIFSKLTVKRPNRWHTLLWCFYCWLWVGICSQVSKWNFSRSKHHTQ